MAPSACRDGGAAESSSDSGPYGGEHPSTPPLPKEGRIDRHEPIALQQTGYEAPRWGRLGGHLARVGLRRGVRHDGLLLVPERRPGAAGMDPRT
jgi:hypothetical protein